MRSPFLPEASRTSMLHAAAFPSGSYCCRLSASSRHLDSRSCPIARSAWDHWPVRIARIIKWDRLVVDSCRSSFMLGIYLDGSWHCLHGSSIHRDHSPAYMLCVSSAESKQAGSGDKCFAGSTLAHLDRLCGACTEIATRLIR